MALKRGRTVFSPVDVKKVLARPYSLWAYIAVLPLVRPLSRCIANRTDFTPNRITFISFLFSIGSAACFVTGDLRYAVAGGFLFEISYLFDCVDGTIARLRGTGTYLGELWDHLADRVKDNGLFFAIAFGCYRSTGDVLWFYYGFGMIFVYSLYYTRVMILDVIELKHANRRGCAIAAVKKEKRGKLLSSMKGGPVKSMIAFFWKREINPTPSGPEVEALVFFFGPIGAMISGLYAYKIAFIAGAAVLLLTMTVRTIYTMKVARKN